MSEEIISVYKFEIEQAKQQLRDIEARLTGVDEKATKGAKSTSDSFNKSATSIKGASNEVSNLGKESTKLDNTSKQLGKTLLAAFSVGAVIALGKQIIDITAKFQRFEAVLTNTLGSKSAAQKALRDIQDFAAKTPFSVEELTSSFVKLANQGFKPTVAELTKLGDVAASQGKSFDQLTEALIDAQVGEFERLKEFGIRASKEGDKVKFAFKGVKTDVDFTNEAIRGYVLGLGDVSGVTGGMAAISGTLGGKISNLGDSFDKLFNTLGSASSGIISTVIDQLGKAVDDTTFLLSKTETAAEQIKRNSESVFDSLVAENRKKTEAQLEIQKKITLENIRLLLEERKTALASGNQLEINAANKSVATEQQLKDSIVAVQVERTKEKERLRLLEEEKFRGGAKKRAEDQKKADKEERERAFKAAVGEYNLIKENEKAIADLEAEALKEIEDKAKEQGNQATKDLKDQLAKEDQIIQDHNDRRTLETKAGSIERNNIEIELLKENNAAILNDTILSDDAKFNQTALNNERIEELEGEVHDKRLKRFIEITELATQVFGILNQLSQAQTQQDIADIDSRAQSQLDANQKVFDSSKQSVEDKAKFEKKKGEIEAKAKADKAKLLTDQAIQDKAFAIFQIGVRTAIAVITALTSIPFNPFAATAAGIIGAAELAATIATPIPKFFHGTPFVEQGNNPSGKDKIPAMLHKGERVVTEKDNAKYWDVFEHLRLGSFEKNYVSKNNVSKLLEAQVKEYKKAQKSDFANNIANSILLNQKGLNDGNIVEGLKMARKQAKENAEYIVKGISNNTRSNPRKF